MTCIRNTPISPFNVLHLCIIAQRWVAVVFLKYFMSFEFCAEFNGNRCMRRVAIGCLSFMILILFVMARYRYERITKEGHGNVRSSETSKTTWIPEML